MKKIIKFIKKIFSIKCKTHELIEYKIFCDTFIRCNKCDLFIIKEKGDYLKYVLGDLLNIKQQANPFEYLDIKQQSNQFKYLDIDALNKCKEKQI